MGLDRFRADVQLLSDLGVRAPLGRQPRDPQLARGERVDTGPGDPSRTGPGRAQLLLGAGDQAVSSASVAQLQPGGQVLARLGPLLVPAHRGPQLNQRSCVL